MAATLLLLAALPGALAQRGWLDSTRSIEARAAALVAALTPEERLGQLNSRADAVPRLALPAFDYWTGCAHGVAEFRAEGATVFPMPLGLAATFDEGLMQEVASVFGDELRAKANAAFKKNGELRDPNINIFRDPRWGRGAETFGEDPVLTGRFARAFVRGLQWGGAAAPQVGAGAGSAAAPRGFLKAAATCKHFAAYSLEELDGVTRMGFDAVVDARDLRDTYLPAFEACVREGVASVMCSYNAINGTPACASDWLLNTTLRQGWKFGGFVVSDCEAIEAISNPFQHGWAAGAAEGAAAALRAGTDLACKHYDALRGALERGLVRQAEVDAALERLLVSRLRQGHFDHDPAVAAWADQVAEACSCSDVCVFFLGSSMVANDTLRKSRAGAYDLVAPATEGEMLDRRSLLLPATQLSLVQAAARRSNATLVVVLVHGGPLDVSWLQQSPRVGAILTAWFPGQGAEAIADVLFGDVSPSGRLPVTFYFDNYTTQVDMDDMRMRPWPGRTHRFLRVPPLYPFGHGLSYARLGYSISAAGAKAGNGSGPASVASSAVWFEVAVDVRHRGGMASEEVVLLFLSRQPPRAGGAAAAQQQPDAPAALNLTAACSADGAAQQAAGEADNEGVPVQSLGGFGRLSLQPKQAAVARFKVTAGQLAAFNATGGAQPPCGRYWLRAGSALAAVDVAAPAAALVAAGGGASHDPASALSSYSV
eukprot:scaffold6.g2667.t1